MIALVVSGLAFALVIASVWYVPRRLSNLLGLRRTAPLYVAFTGVLVLFFVYLSVLSTSANPMAGFAAYAAGLLFGLHIYLFLALLVLEIPRRLDWISRRLMAAAAIGASTAIVLFGVWKASHFDVAEMEIPIQGLAEDVTIMHIADVHLGHHRGKEYLDEVVRRTIDRDPDLVLISGDLVDGNSAVDPVVLSSLSRLPAPSFFTVGNHELYVDTERALEIIAAHGVRILLSELVETHGIQLIGLDYMNADEDAFDLHASEHTSTIKSELRRIETRDDLPLIVMHHSPVGIEYVLEKNADLMLAGHTHGGQVFPGTVVAKWVFAVVSGLHRIEDTYVYVSPGAGTFMLPLRIGTSQQIEFIRLVPADS